MTVHAGAPDLALAFCSAFYEDVALNELAASIGARLVQRLAPGVLLVRVASAPLQITRTVQSAPPVFTRQLLTGVVRTSWGESPPASASPLGAWPYVLICDLEGRDVPGFAAPHALQAPLLEAVQTTAAAHQPGGASPTSASRYQAEQDSDASTEPAADYPVLIVLADGLAYVGRMLPGAGLQMPVWPGGRPRLPYQPSLVSRSALKLLEALETFAIPTPPGHHALDLGAAPGGWTQVLAVRGLRVTAIDPGQLDPRVASLPGVTAIAATAQAYLASVQARNRPRLSAGQARRVRNSTHRVPWDPGVHALIVNDMHLDARASARIMGEMAALLRPEGAGVITLKLPRAAPTAILRQALAILAARYPVLQARCLYFNRNEVTVCLRMR